MQNQEQARILNQLKLLRQQSLTQYLGTNLQSLANKEVIEDILRQFISLHEDDFLTNISNSIIEVKEKYRTIKNELKLKEEQQGLMRVKVEKQLKGIYQKEMEQFFQKWLTLEELCNEKCGEKNPSKAIQRMSDQIVEERKKTQKQKENIQKLMKEYKNKQDQNSSLNQQLKTLNEEIKTLKNQINMLNQRAESNQLMNKSLQEQVYQKHIKLQEMKLAYEQLQGSNVNKRELMEFLQNNACRAREENVKLRHQVELIEKSKEKLEIQCNSLRGELQGMRRESERKQEDDRRIDERISELKRNCQETLGQNQELKTKMSLLDKRIAQSQKQLQQSIKELQTTSHQKNQLQSTVQRLHQQIASISNQLGLQSKKCSILQQAVKEKQKLMRSYIEAKDQQIREIQQELNILKEEATQRQDQEKQYQLYLQEIVQLKQKIKELTPTKYQTQLQFDFWGRPKHIKNKRTKIFFLLTQISNKFIHLRQQKIDLTKFISRQSQEMKEYTSRIIHLINAKIYETKLNCDYCDHTKTKIHQDISLENDQKNAYVKKMSFDNVRSEPTLMRSKMERQEHQLMKTREILFKSPNIVHQKINNNSIANHHYHQQQLSSTQTMVPINRGSKKNLQKLNEKMKAINQQNSLYQLHLSRILSESRIQ